MLSKNTFIEKYLFISIRYSYYTSLKNYSPLFEARALVKSIYARA